MKAVKLELLVAAPVAAALSLLLATAAWAAFDLEPVGPAERGCAVRVALMGFGEGFQRGVADGSGLTDSSAALGGRSARAASVSIYGFRPFGVSGIDFAAVSARFPVGAPGNCLGIGYGRLEAPGYLEHTYLVSAGIGAGCAVIRPAVQLGAVIAEGAFADWAALAGISAAAAVSSDIRVAAEVHNFLGLGLMREGSRCPRRLCVGLGVRASPGLRFGIEAAKSAGAPTCFRSGVEWEAARAIALRAGLGTSPKEFAVGVGLRLGRVVLDAASSVNLDLGATHEAGLTVLWE
ncbi:MAG: hypothetical protein WAW06_11595 [bacterium]